MTMRPAAFPTIAATEMPWLGVAQMVEVDRLMVEEYAISLVRMMECAGRDLAALTRQRFLGSDLCGTRVVVLAGSGGNGGGAMVAARRLHCWGAHVTVTLTRSRASLQGVPAEQAAILAALKVPIVESPALPKSDEYDVVIDGMIGYSLAGTPRGAAAELITWSRAQRAPVLALDVPSGIDADSGAVNEPSVSATATMTLALPKRGLRAAAAAVGELYLADIGVPPRLYRSENLQLEVGAMFGAGEILRVVDWQAVVKV